LISVPAYQSKKWMTESGGATGSSQAGSGRGAADCPDETSEPARASATEAAARSRVGRIRDYVW
jgi:hypothetical protein